MIKVIIAEDLNILRKRIVCAINSQTDMKVVAEASTGMEITRLAEACEFDIALIDIEMESREAGINATMDILKLKPESQIIILTLHDSDEMVFKALEGGAVDYIIKSEDTTKVIQQSGKHMKARMYWIPGFRRNCARSSEDSGKARTICYFSYEM